MPVSVESWCDAPAGAVGEYTGEAVNPRNLSLLEGLLRVGVVYKPSSKDAAGEGTELRAVSTEGSPAAGDAAAA